MKKISRRFLAMACTGLSVLTLATATPAFAASNELANTQIASSESTKDAGEISTRAGIKDTISFTGIAYTDEFYSDGTQVSVITENSSSSSNGYTLHIQKKFLGFWFDQLTWDMPANGSDGCYLTNGGSGTYRLAFVRKGTAANPQNVTYLLGY